MTKPHIHIAAARKLLVEGFQGTRLEFQTAIGCGYGTITRIIDVLLKSGELAAIGVTTRNNNISTIYGAPKHWLKTEPDEKPMPYWLAVLFGFASPVPAPTQGVYRNTVFEGIAGPRVNASAELIRTTTLEALQDGPVELGDLRGRVKEDAELLGWVKPSHFASALHALEKAGKVRTYRDERGQHIVELVAEELAEAA